MMSSRSIKKKRKRLLSNLRRRDAAALQAWADLGLTTVVTEAEERERLQRLLDRYDSVLMERQAEQWGIEIPAKPEWWDREFMSDEDRDSLNVPLERVRRAWLNEKGRTMVGKQIRDARFAYWKGWVDLLIPPLALIVAGLALFKDIIVEAVKKSQ